ncbi:MAG: insulinase family protein [Myxococcota bacterium]
MIGKKVSLLWVRGLYRFAITLLVVQSCGVACSGSSFPRRRPNHTAPLPELVEDGSSEPSKSGEMHLAWTARDTPNWIRVALFIDAGSLDVVPPQAATVAAWAAASRSELEARVTPDNIELFTECPKQNLNACLQRLALALASRELDEAQLSICLRRLVQTRRNALSDGRRYATQLAMSALFGHEHWNPLGASSADIELTKLAIEEFWKTHFGPERALVVLVGDVEGEDLEKVKDIFSDAPATSIERRPLPEPSRLAQEVVVTASVGTSRIATLAFSAPDTSTARSASYWIQKWYEQPDVEFEAFSVRNVSLLLIHLKQPSASVVQHMAWAGTNAILHPIENTPPATSPDSTARLSRQIGYRWSSQSRRPQRSGGDVSHGVPHLGIGVVSPTGTSDTELSLVEEFNTAAKRGRDIASTRASLVWEGRDATATLANGSKLRVRRRLGHERSAIAVGFQVGASHDPPGLHGRSALAAHSLVESCARALPSQWSLVPLVTAEWTGFVLETPSWTFNRAIGHAMACTLRSPTTAHIAKARSLLLEQSEHPSRRSATWAAHALAPDRPGLIAPHGAKETLGNVTAREVRALLNRIVIAGQTTVVLLSDENLQAHADRAARWLALLPQSGRALSEVLANAEQASFSSPQDPITKDWRESPSQVSITFALESVDLSRLLLRSWMQAFAMRLTRELPSDIHWQEGGSSSAGSWVSIGIEIDSRFFDAVPAAVRRAQQVSLNDLESRLVHNRNELQRQTAETHLAAALLLTQAGLLDREQTGVEFHASELQGFLDNASRSTPRYVIGHPRARSSSAIEPGGR